MTHDRQARFALWLLLVLALAVNLDRFVYGRTGPLRAHDVADNTVTGLASCGDFWRSGLQSTWDPTQLGGWPRIGSAMNPQHAMCIAGGFLPMAYILPVMETLLLVLIAAGSYLFARRFLRASHEASIGGALTNVSLYFFFHEHPFIPSAILLPPLVGILAQDADTLGQRVCMFLESALIIGLSNPPATLIIMPVGHLLLLLAARHDRRRQLLRMAAFWCAYGLYYGPTMVVMLRQFPISSRSLYRAGVESEGFLTLFTERLLNPAVVSPAFILVVLVSRRTARVTLGLFAGILAFIAVSAGNDVLLAASGARLPFLAAASSAYYRMYYFVPIPVLIWAVRLFDDTRHASARRRLSQILGAAVFCWVAARFLPAGRVFIPFWIYAAMIGSVGVGLWWWTRDRLAVFAVAAAVLMIGRHEFTWVYEVPNEGNLFVELPHYGRPAELGRTVTVMADCDAVDVYPAQARAAGEDTLDGISNYYSRSFVEHWRDFVATHPSTCTARYATWSTRAEVTAADMAISGRAILPWFWINNVTYVRSAVPLDGYGLEFVDRRTYNVDGLHHVWRYLYRFPSPVTRVFTMPGVAARAAAGDHAAESNVLDGLARDGSVGRIHVTQLNGSHLRFSGSFAADVAVVASVNFHSGWHVLVDGREAAPLQPGPFGLVRVPTVPGSHLYDLVFRSPATPLVPLFMVAGLLLLWAVPRLDGRNTALTSSRPAGDNHAFTH